jgi:hypothetical protein
MKKMKDNVNKFHVQMQYVGHFIVLMITEKLI